GGGTLQIALTPSNGGKLWTRSSRVSSAGTWTVVYVAAPSGATAGGGTITVTAPPTSTPRPTPKPAATPRPSSQATHAATASPRRSSSGPATAAVSPSGKPPST